MSFRGFFGPRTPPVRKPEPALPAMEGPWMAVLRALRASGVEARILVQAAEQEGAPPDDLAALVLHYLPWLGSVRRSNGIPDPEALLALTTTLFTNPAPVVKQLLGSRSPEVLFRLLIRDPDAPALAGLRAELDLPRELNRALGPSRIDLSEPLGDLDLQPFLRQADCDLCVEGPVGCLYLPNGWRARGELRLRRTGGLRSLSLEGFRSQSGCLEIEDCPDLQSLRIGNGLARAVVRNCPSLTSVSIQSTRLGTLDLIGLPALCRLELARPRDPSVAPDLRLEDCPALTCLLPTGRHVRPIRSLSLVGCAAMGGLPPNLHVQKDLAIGECPALDPALFARQVKGRIDLLQTR